MKVKYELIHQDKTTGARYGRAIFTAPDGSTKSYETPMFMPVGTQATVKTHSNVGIELVLNFDGFFRREEEFAAVNFGLEMDSFFGDVFLFVARKTENLITTRIG